MNQPLRFFKLIQTAAIIAVALLYGLAPLQQPLADGFHKLEHALLNTDGHHSHDTAYDLELAHSHEHQLLSFFNDLFQDQSSEDDAAAKELKLDKHILQYRASLKHGVTNSSEENFNYNYIPYSVALPYTYPPPELYFS